MIQTQELRAAIVRKGYTQAEVAIKLGITSKTFSNKLKKGVFGSNEIEILIELLDIHDPISIFFANAVTSEDTINSKRDITSRAEYVVKGGERE